MLWKTIGRFTEQRRELAFIEQKEGVGKRCSKVKSIGEKKQFRV